LFALTHLFLLPGHKKIPANTIGGDFCLMTKKQVLSGAYFPFSVNVFFNLEKNPAFSSHE